MATSLSPSSSLSFSHFVASSSIHKGKNQLTSQCSAVSSQSKSTRLISACRTAATATAAGSETDRTSASSRSFLPSTQPSMESLYEVLGVQASATSQEIKTAYRTLARVLHPDVARRNGLPAAESADKFKRIHEAYSTLSDPKKREHYDSTIFMRRPSVGTPLQTRVSSGITRFTRRSWETDQCW